MSGGLSRFQWPGFSDLSSLLLLSELAYAAGTSTSHISLASSGLSLVPPLFPVSSATSFLWIRSFHEDWLRDSDSRVALEVVLASLYPLAKCHESRILSPVFGHLFTVQTTVRNILSLLISTIAFCRLLGPILSPAAMAGPQDLPHPRSSSHSSASSRPFNFPEFSEYSESPGSPRSPELYESPAFVSGHDGHYDGCERLRKINRQHDRWRNRDCYYFCNRYSKINPRNHRVHKAHRRKKKSEQDHNGPIASPKAYRADSSLRTTQSIGMNPSHITIITDDEAQQWSRSSKNTHETEEGEGDIEFSDDSGGPGEADTSPQPRMSRSLF